jgi:hypothetical protein
LAQAVADLAGVDAIRSFSLRRQLPGASHPRCGDQGIQPVDAAGKIHRFEPFSDREFLDRGDNRMLLKAICPEIRVERYVVKSLTLNADAPDGDEVRRNRVAVA